MKRRQQGKAVFDLIEEAVHLLRTAPVATLAVYYLGAIPFVLGLLYFWTDMSRSPFAGQHLADSALGVAALFLWMKFWQVIFTRRLRAHIAVKPVPSWTVRCGGRVFLTQAFVQPTGLFVIPLSFIPVLPVAWVYAFYQNVTVLDNGGPEGLTSLLKKSWRQATFWPRQNLLALAILATFGFYIFLNWMAAGFMLPFLIKMLFGIELVFTRSPFSMLNTTFFAGMASLTYLCVDPILKAVYVLRCFYGESLRSGEDLRAELNSIAVGSRSVSAMVVITLGLICASSVRAADASVAATQSTRVPISSSVKPTDLNRAINRTIQEDKYTWRMPREKIAESDTQEGTLGRFFDKIGATLREWVRAVLHWLDEWLRKLFRPPRMRSSFGSSGYSWIESLQILLYGLVAVVLAALAILLYCVWQDRWRPLVTASEPIQPVPDLQDENVGADQLPEDGWTRLARELLERGELRLALRAFYFASLSHLAARNLISIARFKSNRDYERELLRRAHSFPGLLLTFGDNLTSFERIWYGLHEVNRELVDRFAANVERIKTGG
ncbi:MAG TPA: hypothetical protein VMA13_12215 [Candidatus Saccharimonadales bacterium]|nr:hypothetical protein [Candidatus Saccharimonadales bacterium]